MARSRPDEHRRQERQERRAKPPRSTGGPEDPSQVAPIEEPRDTRLPGEMESAMRSGSGDEGDLSSFERRSDPTPEEARRVLTEPAPDKKR